MPKIPLTFEEINTKDPVKLSEIINRIFLNYRAYVKRKADGILKFDYLVPGGPHYPEHWDWDGFFTGMALATDISSEAIFLRNWVLNYIINAKPDGKIAGTLRPEGWDSRIRQMKPFLAQGAYFAGRFLNDFSWLKPHWNKFLAIVTYREKHFWDKKYDLGYWYNWIESGADDNVALILYPEKSVLAVDFNTFIYREYHSLSRIASKFQKSRDARYFADRADKIKKGINKYLWNGKIGMYCNIFLKTDRHINRTTYSNFIPIWAKIASQKQADIAINRFMLSYKHLNTPYGMTTLSKSDPAFNNDSIIKPYSNWQGPIWPHVNYLYMHGLLNYGYSKQALELAVKITKVLLHGLETHGSTFENYNSETGKPLAAPNMVGWNLLVGNMIKETLTNSNPFEIK